MQKTTLSVKVTKLNQKSVLLCLKIYTVNQTTVPLDMGKYIPETIFSSNPWISPYLIFITLNETLMIIYY